MTKISTDFEDGVKNNKVRKSGMAAAPIALLLVTGCATTDVPHQIISDTTTINANTCAIERQATTYLGDEAIDQRALTVGLDPSCLQAERDALVARGMAQAFYETTLAETSNPSQVEVYGEAMLAALYGDNPVARQAVESVLRENNTDQGDIAVRVNEARRQMEEVIRPRDCTERRGVMPNGEEVTYNDCRTTTGSLDTRQWNPTNIRPGRNHG